ncbi:MAG: prepilin-type N-terminal cleavage/methylation domain-containing protein [Planctomycetaceae bacterium]|nr:prepilin-type N-terminal cleavage/methylation domain-containing protein [Planctomycetaceae bacterium]
MFEASNLIRLSNRIARGGFTLTELLVVIAIMAVLAGISIPAVMMAVNSAYEFRVSTKINSYDTAVETFRNEKGLYPPDQYYDHDGSYITWISPTQNDAALLPILVQRYGPLLQKIAPNHREFQPAVGAFAGTDYPIVAWYRQRGQFLNPTNALGFWLGGGLSNSTMYPLSESCRRASELPVTNAAANTAYTNRISQLQPLVYAEFPSTAVDPLGYWTGGASAPSWTAGAQAGNQYYPQGTVPAFLRSPTQEASDRPLLYFVDVKGATTTNTLYAPYLIPNSRNIKYVPVTTEANPMTPVGWGLTNNQMFAVDKFQIIAAGRDNFYGGGGVPRYLRDNICNFANSKRLDSVDAAIDNMGL